jgi:shikimate dehydrogenase
LKSVGLIGYPVSHSLSPLMQQAAFDAMNVEAEYVLWETRQDHLAGKIASLRSPAILGANVTIPYKEEVLQWIDECDSLVTRIGAINTIVNRDSRLIGYNTDAPGFISTLCEAGPYPFDCDGKKVVILGTGGAARAACVGLLEKGVGEVVLLGRNEAQLQKILRHLNTLAVKIHSTSHVVGALFSDSDVTEFLSTTDLVVNATPVGLKSGDSTLLIDVKAIPISALVMDMVFNPPLTPLLRTARSHGCQVLNGLSMLLYQGALAFELWTGQPAPIKVMQKALGLAKEG